jgi:hypothetical protein
VENLKSFNKDPRRPEKNVKVLSVGEIVDAEGKKRHFEIVEYKGGYTLELDGHGGNVSYNSLLEAFDRLVEHMNNKDFNKDFRSNEPRQYFF